MTVGIQLFTTQEYRPKLLCRDRYSSTCYAFATKPSPVPSDFMVSVTFSLQNPYRCLWENDIRYLWKNDIKSTVAGIYALRQLQFKRFGRLDLKALLALDCCSTAIGSDCDRCDSFGSRNATTGTLTHLSSIEIRHSHCHCEKR